MITWDLVKRQLGVIRLVYPDAVVAGGAIRDLELGVEPRDIDVFIPGVPLGGLQNIYPPFVLKTGERQYDHRHFQVYETIISSGVKLQLIFHRFVQPPVLCETFDPYFCQIFFDGEEVHSSQACEDDLNNKTITYVRGRSSEDRIKRFAERFPDFTLRPLDAPL